MAKGMGLASVERAAEDAHLTQLIARNSLRARNQQGERLIAGIERNKYVDNSAHEGPMTSR